MRHEWRALLVGLIVPLVACGEAREGARGAASDFCGPAMARVDSFFATAPPSPEDPRYGGTAVVGGIGELADGMMYFVNADWGATQHQQFVNLMTLIQYDGELEPIPYLARSWEVSDDLGELTFHLRDDVRWHDGEKTTAYDVEFTYLRLTDPETAFPNSAFWTHYVPGPGGVEVVDSFTVRIGLRPHAQYMDPWRSVVIMPRHLLEDVPPGEFAQHPYGTRCPVGNGPFRFVEHRQDESWTFEASPFFPDDLGGRPHLDRLVFRIITEETTLLTDLLTGNTDVFIAPRPDQADAILESGSTRLLHFPFRNFSFVGWNTRRPQLADARVRKAITLATDRQELVDGLLGGYGVVANAGVPPFHWAYDPALADTFAHDPGRARALLEEAGWVDRDGDGVRENADGLPLSFTIKYNQGNQIRQDVAEVMQSALREVEIDARPVVVEWATLTDQVFSPERDFDGVVLGWVNEFKIDDTDLFHSSKIGEPYAFAGIRDPRVDRLLDTLQLVVDREDAIPLWREYQRLILDVHPYTYLFFQERLEGIGTRLRDVEMDIRGEWINAREWWIPAEERKYGSAATPR